MKRAVRAFAGVVIAVLSLSLIGFGQTTSATIMGRSQLRGLATMHV